jgi:seryl-tRNA synthetase
MLDIKLIREQPDLVRTKLTQTGVDAAEVERVLEADARRRKMQHEPDDISARFLSRSSGEGLAELLRFASAARAFTFSRTAVFSGGPSSAN